MPDALDRPLPGRFHAPAPGRDAAVAESAGSPAATGAVRWALRAAYPDAFGSTHLGRIGRRRQG